MMEDEEITKKYKENEKKYKDFSSRIVNLLYTLFEKNKIKYAHFEDRIKELERVIEKSQRKNYNNPFEQMPDIVGIRIVTHYKNEIETIRKLISEEFKILEVTNKESELEPDKFGYRDLHLVLCLNDDRAKLSEYSEFKNLKAEIQLRTILQHAWDSLSRQVDYNSSIESPNSLKRKMFQLSALLELADDEFINVVKEKTEIINQYNSTIRENNLDIPLDYESLKLYFTKYFNVNHFNKIITDQIKNYKGTLKTTPQVDTKTFNDFLFSLNKINFNTLNDLDKWINKLEKEGLKLDLLTSLFNSIKRGGYISFDIIHFLFFQLHQEFFQNENWRVGMSWVEA